MQHRRRVKGRLNVNIIVEFCRYVSDGLPAIFVAILLFICPSRRPNFLCNRKKSGWCWFIVDLTNDHNLETMDTVRAAYRSLVSLTFPVLKINRPEYLENRSPWVFPMNFIQAAAPQLVEMSRSIHWCWSLLQHDSQHVVLRLASV